MASSFLYSNTVYLYMCPVIVDPVHNFYYNSMMLQIFK